MIGFAIIENSASTVSKIAQNFLPQSNPMPPSSELFLQVPPLDILALIVFYRGLVGLCVFCRCGTASQTHAYQHYLPLPPCMDAPNA